MKFHRIIIVGIGQIGASIGLALRRARLARELVGVDTDPKQLAIVQRKGITCYRLEKREDLLLFDFQTSDLIILAVPVLSICSYLKILKRGPLIIDVGSTKRSQVAIAREKRLRYIGAHPVAGTERSGAQAGDPDLFRGRLCFLCPPPGTEANDLRLVVAFWKKLGAKVSQIDPLRHDRLFAAISHLPHAVSFSFMRGVSKALAQENIASWVEGSFRDMTRVAASPPDVWTEIFLDNRQALIPLIDRLRHELERLGLLIHSKDRASLRRWLAHAKRSRANLR